ncbi:MAG: hypothetical protein EAZ21_09810 [Betaproteobacteria bacterium]|nr:MAG: hypothetical protein EAZ21_09810 [Betaproteobacteria bacterium]
MDLKRLMMRFNNTRLVGKSLICFVGTFRGFDATRESLIRHLIQPLNADVVVCMVSSPEPLELLRRECASIGATVYDATYDSREQNYDLVFDRLSLELGVKPKWRERAEVAGNWLGGIGNRLGAGTHQLFNFWKLAQWLRMVRFDFDAYERVLVSRTDLRWLGNHPPLDLLQPQYLWTPSGEEYGGINDRHWVLPRGSEVTCLDALTPMLVGPFRHWKTHNLNRERFVAEHIRSVRVEARQFPSIAYLSGEL